MRKFLGCLLAFFFSMTILSGQSEDVSRVMGPNDSLTVKVRFEPVISRNEMTAQDQINMLLMNSVKTNEVLTTSINRLTTTIEESTKLATLTKADIVAAQLNISKADINKYYKRNNTILLISLLPTFVIAFWSMGSFLFQKGLDIKHLLAGTATMTLYGILGSATLYALLSLILNKQYFVIKNLMSALF